VEVVATRVLSEDDPRAALNQPPDPVVLAVRVAGLVESLRGYSGTRPPVLVDHLMDAAAELAAAVLPPVLRAGRPGPVGASSGAGPAHVAPCCHHLPAGI
jgi:hypothetical protein